MANGHGTVQTGTVSGKTDVVCAQNFFMATVAPKLADMVRAQNFFKCNRRKPILQATVAS
jgi:hypothetical protein